LIRILLDQCVPRSAATILRNGGWDVVHTGEIGLSRAMDAYILEYATNENRIIVTLDADFHSILAVEGLDKPSVIRIRLEGLKSREMATLLQKIWPKIQPEVDAGAMVAVTEKSIRIKSLPI
jgi:predicted nuclease of predicted toxin-antitoxin system